MKAVAIAAVVIGALIGCAEPTPTPSNDKPACANGTHAVLLYDGTVRCEQWWN
jgi:hypothetical protein